MHKKIEEAFSIITLALFLSGCSSGLFFRPTTTQSPSPTLIPTYTPTLTATPTITFTRTPTFTFTPLPGLGVTANEVAVTFKGVDFVFSAATDDDGAPIQKGVTSDGYMSMTLSGDPYLTSAELQIDMAQEDSFIATACWILFLATTSHGEKPAADWVHDNYYKAFNMGIARTTIGNEEIILRTTGNKHEIFHLIVHYIEQ